MDSEELSEQSQLGKNKAEESYVKEGRKGHIEVGEKNKNEEEEEDKQEEEEVESEKEDDNHHGYKQEEEEVESEKEDDDQDNDNASPMRCKLRLKSQYDPIKTISIDRAFHSNRLEMRCPIEPFIKETPRKRSMVSRTTKAPPSNRGKALTKQPTTKTNKHKEKIDGLLEITGRSYKTVNLIEDLKDKTIPKQYREKLCFVWFAHSIILARDVNKDIEDDLLALAKDFEKFNDYPWGYDDYKDISKDDHIIQLFLGFHTIRPLRKQVKDYPDEVSHPRVLRWLAAKSSTRIKEVDLFNPSDDAVLMLMLM
ncbi:hypothetical protein FXO37_19042 [Capsicum annuum]|nr:hypothetical protein FXO37_19042 [Capsicum annuum]